MAFEQLGPTFVKFGQLLATRPDLIPKDFIQEFKKLQDNVQTLKFSEIKNILESEYDKPYLEIFSEIDEIPLAAASIAQVHCAKLKTGEEVVLKIQRPGIVKTIKEDLVVLYNLAHLLESYVPESKVFNPVSIIDEFFKTMELETDFVIEANNILRFQKNFADDKRIKIPQVYLDYTSERVLVLERIKGKRLSETESLPEMGVDPQEIAELGLTCFMQMVFRDGFFHGDLHAGNIFVDADKNIVLIDFGVVGRLSEKIQESISIMLLALANEDYEQLAYEFIDVAPYTDRIDPDRYANELRSLISPYFGLTFKNVDLGRLLLDACGIGSQHGLVLPSELLLFFKAIVTVEGMGRNLVEDFDILSLADRFSSEIVKNRYDPQKISKNLSLFARESSTLLQSLPRYFKQSLRRIESSEYAKKIQIQQMEDIKRSIESSSNILFLGLVIGALIIGSSIALFVKTTHFVGELPLLPAIGYGLALFLSTLAFYNYIKK